jgi:hypothetical protein
MLDLVAASRRVAPPATETIADSMRRWEVAAAAAPGTQRVGGRAGREVAGMPAPELERITRLKRLPKTTTGRAAPRFAGAYAL